MKHGFLGYMDGKRYIADWIVSYFPKHHTFVDVFGGSGSVTFEKTQSYTEVYNDKWGDIVNLFLVLRDKSQLLKDKLKLTPFSRDLYGTYLKKYHDRDFSDDIERAIIIFYLLRVSQNCDINQGFRIRIKRSGSRDVRFVTDKMLEFAERFRNVTIENLDFRDCIKKYDSPDTLFYCDPPYLGLNYYQEKFEYRDHYELAKLLRNIEGKVAISYYPKSGVLDLYPEGDWYYRRKKVVKWSLVKHENEEKVEGEEILIFNYNPEKLRKNKELIEV